MIIFVFSTTSTDPRSEHYPLLGSPVPITIIIIGYLYFCLDIGQRWMANRKPYDLKNVMMVFNFLQIVANLGIGIRAVYLIHSYANYSWMCQGLDYSDNEFAIHEVQMTYAYFLLKGSDLMDTVRIYKKI